MSKGCIATNSQVFLQEQSQEMLHIHIIGTNIVHFSLIFKLIPQSIKTSTETIVAVSVHNIRFPLSPDVSLNVPAI